MIKKYAGLLGALLILSSVSTQSFGNGLLIIYEDKSEFYVVPVSSILSITVNEDNKLEIHLNAYPSSKGIWNAEIEGISEEKSLDLIKSIFDPKRTENLAIKVNDIN